MKLQFSWTLLSIALLLSYTGLTQSFDADQTPSATDVSPTGGLTHTIPIAVPKGILDIVPNVALNYNSQAGPGIAGYGWGISGISSIVRVPSNIFLDNVIDPVDFDAFDRFALDGVRLILKEGVYGNPGSTYQLEKFSHTLVKAVGGSPGRPRSFIVYDGKGNTSWYGIDIQSKGSMEYALRRIENPKGVSIQFYYNNNDGILTIDSIHYGSTGLASGNGSIRFMYEEKEVGATVAFVEGKKSIQNTILKSIKVTQNGKSYREYKLHHALLPEGYYTIHSISEHTATKRRNPITFSYTTTEQGNYIKLNKTRVIPNSDIKNIQAISGNFSGDGTLGMVAFDRIRRDKFTYFANITSSQNISDIGRTTKVNFKTMFPSKLIKEKSHTLFNKFVPDEDLLTTVTEGDDLITFTHYGVNPSTGAFSKLYSIDWEAPTTFENKRNCIDAPENLNISRSYYPGDFDGDGITDVIVHTKYHAGQLCQYVGIRDCQCESFINTDQFTYLQLYKDQTSDELNTYTLEGLSFEQRPNTVVPTDFDGDGKTDIVTHHIHNNTLRVYSHSPDDRGIIRITKTHEIPNINLSEDEPIFFADSNADGRPELIQPNGEETSEWKYFINTGIGLSEEVRNLEIPYRKSGIFTNGERPHSFSAKDLPPGVDPIIPAAASARRKLFEEKYITRDFNGDGKTDILHHEIVTPVDAAYQQISSEIITIYYSQLDAISGEVTFRRELVHRGFNSGVRNSGNSLFLTLSDRSSSLDYAYQSADKIFGYKMKYDLRQPLLMKRINTGKSIYNIEYGNTDTDPIIDKTYDRNQRLSYPIRAIGKFDNTALVREIEHLVNINGTSNSSRIKKFRYRNGYFDMRSNSFGGFGLLARTNWFGDDVSEIWTMELYSSGAILTNSWTSEVFQTNMNARSFIERTSYVNAKVGGVFSKLSSAMPTRIEKINNLTKTTLVTTFVYDAYWNPTKVITKDSKNTFSTTVENDYYNRDASTNGYQIGILTSTTETRVRDGHTFTTTKDFVHNGSLNIIQTKTTSNGGETMIEDVEYDGKGNIVRREFDLVNNKRGWETYKYQNDGRRIKEYNNHLGEKIVYETYEYDKSELIKSETDRFGNKTVFNYDEWKRLNYKAINRGPDIFVELTRFEEIPGGMTITTTRSSGEKTVVKTNGLNLPFEEQINSINDKNIFTRTTYDVAGRVTAKSEPNDKPSGYIYTKTGYDIYGRIHQVVLPAGRIVTTTYNELESTVDDEVKTTTTEVDVLGQVVSKTDPGGTITYKYYANGELKEVDYDSHKVTFEIDGWGRQKSITDPSAGKYTFNYDKTGSLLKESTPKGSTTYIYYSNGLLHKKNISGVNTQMQIEHKLDEHNRVYKTTGQDVKNASMYTYQYIFDDYNRTTQITEDVDGAHTKHSFKRSTKYDGYSRISEETFESHFGGVSEEMKLKRVYDRDSGVLYKLEDVNSQEAIWELKETNNRGQATRTRLGNGYTQYRHYDKYGKIKDILDYYDNPTTKKREYANFYYYAYNDKRGVMSVRENKAMGSGHRESFKYDSMDRLTDVTGFKNREIKYDKRGSITYNSEVGTYKYDTKKLYQIDEIELNGKTRYWPHQTPRRIQYNTFKKPVHIELGGNGFIDMEYGPMMNRTQAHIDKNRPNKDKTKRPYFKVYSSIMPVEITQQRETNQIKIVTYLGGDAYTAVAAKVKQQKNSDVEIEDILYLHRDHLGSLNSITNGKKTVIQQSYYGVWGEWETGYGFGSKLISTHPLYHLDRGFGGHEEFYSVRLIHMNGRMYDPVFHRFLSPDNYVQDPYNTQSFNRYGYVWNNPLGNIDPSGEIIVPMLIGAAISVIANGVSNTINERGFFENAGKAAIFGAIGGAASFGIGQVATSLSNSLVASGVGAVSKSLIVGGYQASLHAFLGGLMNAVQGGDALAGLVSGGLGSVTGSIMGHVGRGNPLATFFGGTISGGIGSELAGGSFIDGARNGAISSGLNHVAHSGALGANVAAALITGKTRHLFGPDATALSGELSSMFGVGNAFEKGILVYHRGSLKNHVEAFDGISLGFGTPSIGADFQITHLYYSGSVQNITSDTYYGYYGQVQFGADLGVGAGIHASTSFLDDGSAVYGFGASIGLGASGLPYGFEASFMQGVTAPSSSNKNLIRELMINFTL